MSVTESAQAADETDASVLEAAAAVLLRRYGQEGGGETACLLNETAAAIRGVADPEPVLTVEDTMDFNGPVHPHAYREAGDC